MGWIWTGAGAKAKNVHKLRAVAHNLRSNKLPKFRTQGYTAQIAEIRYSLNAFRLSIALHCVSCKYAKSVNQESGSYQVGI